MWTSTPSRSNHLRKRNIAPLSPAQRSTSKCPIRILHIILLIVLLLMCLSFYLLSQQMLSEPRQPTSQARPDPPHSLVSEPAIKSAISVVDAADDDDGITDDALLRALHKSLHMYILREGHQDRVEYLIGFRGQRITNPVEYQSLQTRSQQQYDRDYRVSPVRIQNWSPQPATETTCDALCVPCERRQACDIDGVHFSMENVHVREGPNQITGSTRLDSLVPVPYFSWHDFRFMLPAQPKTADALCAAFVSNCSFQKRIKMIRELQQYMEVHSYGRCEHNKDEARKTAHGKAGSKIDLLSTYKFSLAFENSETDDYITEKFFGTLQSGSVPVYIGAPNVKFFAPDAGVYRAGKPWKSKAVVYAGDFDFDAQRLAAFLNYLDQNDTAYQEYVQWKTDGWSGDFQAMVDLTAKTHTRCRQCILGTDWVRHKHGLGRYDVEDMNVFDAGDSGAQGKWFYIRERGMYRFTKVRVQHNTLKSMVKTILLAIQPKPVNFWHGNQHPNYERIGPALYAIYHIPSKHVIHEGIENLPEFAELEVVFV